MNIRYESTDEDGTDTYVLSENYLSVGYVKINLRRGLLVDVWVEQDLRCKKYGTQLVKFAEASFLQKGANQIITCVVGEKSQRFWRKLGYSVQADGTAVKNLE